MLFDSIESVLKNHFGSDFTIDQGLPVHGGDNNQVYKLLTSEGTFLIKINQSSSPELFEKEAKGLELLTKNAAFRIPTILAVDSFLDGQFILLEYISSGEKTPGYWKEFGEQLASMHQNTHDYFGLDHNNYIGSLNQPNEFHKKWSSFYFHERILKQLELLDAKQQLSFNPQQLNALNERIELLFSDQPSSLLHGDLWSGNCMSDERNKPVLIDPAVYYGHREMDLAMTLLFGGFDELFYEAYNQLFPLEKNWRDRLEMCQLYPLLVHANLFGGHYTNSCKNIILKNVEPYH
ncbi:MAG: fructosamine kinase family protein [Crocinitomicaceae bacterium]|nr:fructosamine kinase family protein [Crocinitomicaceae bacterium]